MQDKVKDLGGEQKILQFMVHFCKWRIYFDKDNFEIRENVKSGTPFGKTFMLLKKVNSLKNFH